MCPSLATKVLKSAQCSHSIDYLNNYCTLQGEVAESSQLSLEVDKHFIANEFECLTETSMSMITRMVTTFFESIVIAPTARANT
jgi:hypothetical protein